MICGMCIGISKPYTVVPLCNWPDLLKIFSRIKQLFRNQDDKTDTQIVPF